MLDSMNILMTLSATFSRFQKKVERSLSIHGLSFTEFLVLYQLFEAPNHMMSRIELAEAINLTASGITRLLNPMEKTHLVEKEKNARDARISFVKLTQTGIELYQNAFLTCENCSESLSKNITKKQQGTLLDILRKL